MGQRPALLASAGLGIRIAEICHLESQLRSSKEI
jgi:hypothetical protein